MYGTGGSYEHVFIYNREPKDGLEFRKLFPEYKNFDGVCECSPNCKR